MVVNSSLTNRWADLPVVLFFLCSFFLSYSRSQTPPPLFFYSVHSIMFLIASLIVLVGRNNDGAYLHTCKQQTWEGYGYVFFLGENKAFLAVSENLHILTGCLAARHSSKHLFDRIWKIYNSQTRTYSMTPETINMHFKKSIFVNISEFLPAPSIIGQQDVWVLSQMICRY